MSRRTPRHLSRNSPAEKRARARAALAFAAGAAAFSLSSQLAFSQSTTWLGGNGAWNDPAKWSSGIPNDTTDAVIDGAGGSGVIDIGLTPSVRSFSLDSGYTLTTASAGNRTFYISGSGTVNGSVAFTEKTSFDFRGTGGYTLSGSGTITSGTALKPAGGFRNNSSGPVTIGPGLRFQSYQVAFDGLDGGIENKGTIECFGDTRFTNFINSGTLTTAIGGIRFFGTNWQNLGTLAVDTGSIEFNGTVNSSGIGRIQRGPSGSVYLIATMDCQGSTFTLSEYNGGTWTGTGTFRNGTLVIGSGAHLTGNQVFENITLHADPDGVQPQNVMQLTGRLTLDQTTVSFTNSGSFWLNGPSDATLDGTGLINGPASADMQFDYRSGTGYGIIGPGITIRGGKYFRFRGNSGTFVNQGTIIAEMPGGYANFFDRFTNSGTIKAVGSTINLLANPWQNAGTIDVDGASTLALGGTFTPADLIGIARAPGSISYVSGTVSNTASLFNLSAGTGSWELRNGTIRGGTVAAEPGYSLSVSARATFDAVTLQTAPVLWPGTAGVELVIKNGLTLSNVNLSLAAPGTNYAMLSFSGTTGAQSLLGTGSVTFGPSASNRLSNTSTASVTLGSGILIHGESGTIDGMTNRFANYGTIRADVTGGIITVKNLDNYGTLEATAGTLNIMGTVISSSSVTLSGGILAGSGTVTGNIANAGSITPGSSVGTLTVNGNVLFSSGGRLAAEVQASGARDVLQIIGDLDLSGPDDYLDLIRLDSIPYGTNFVIATYGGTLNGQFDHVPPDFTVSYSTPHSIAVTAVPEPASWGLLGIALALLRRRRSRPTQGDEHRGGPRTTEETPSK